MFIDIFFNCNCIVNAPNSPGCGFYDFAFLNHSPRFPSRWHCGTIITLQLQNCHACFEPSRYLIHFMNVGQIDRQFVEDVMGCLFHHLKVQPTGAQTIIRRLSDEIIKSNHVWLVDGIHCTILSSCTYDSIRIQAFSSAIFIYDIDSTEKKKVY